MQVTTDNNNALVEELVISDRRLKVREISEMLKAVKYKRSRNSVWPFGNEKRECKWITKQLLNANVKLKIYDPFLSSMDQTQSWRTNQVIYTSVWEVTKLRMLNGIRCKAHMKKLWNYIITSFEVNGTK